MGLLPENSLLPALAAAAAAVTATPLLARLAPRLGWADAAVGSLRSRKRQARPVPPVGGAALLVGLGVAAAVEAIAGTAVTLDLGTGPAETAGLLLSLVALFAVGLVDDLRPQGLGPGPKLAAQFAALLPAVAATTAAGGFLAGLAMTVGGLAAVNAANTFDNADGALGSVGLVGFLGSGPVVAGALAGFLPWNLNAREGRPPRPEATPTAYLGDAGSHVVGYLVFLDPLAWMVLLVPVLDLVWLSVERWQRGSYPWVGDRRHLAHRLAARGWSRMQVAGFLAALAAPACLATWRGADAPGLIQFLGVLATVAGYGLTRAILASPNGLRGE